MENVWVFLARTVPESDAFGAYSESGCDRIPDHLFAYHTASTDTRS